MLNASMLYCLEVSSMIVHMWYLVASNIRAKIKYVWLAENRCIFHVTWVQITNVKIMSVLTFYDIFFL